MRLANIITAMSDILAGVAIGGSLVFTDLESLASGHVPLGELILRNNSFEPLYPIVLLLLATIGLYGGGVVLNDVFDGELDKIERPERPIPSGLISKKSASLFGIVLLLAGITAAALSNREDLFSYSTILAVIIAFSAVIYDKWMKNHGFLGPITMGFCRGCNLLLGMSIVEQSVHEYWYIALVPVVYIAAITMISRGEVHGGKRTTLYAAAALYIFVLLSILAVAVLHDTLANTLPFVIIFSILIFIPLQKAINKPEGSRIGKAVKSGVISLILMNAGWAAAFGDLYFALSIILLLPISVLLARAFAVT